MNESWNNDYPNNNNNTNPNNQNSNYQHGRDNNTMDPLDPRSGLSSAAMGLGIASIALCMTGSISIILAGISIVLALLTTRKGQKMLTVAKRRLIFGIVGLIISYFILIRSFYTVLTDPSSRQELNTLSQEIYGESFDDMLGQLGASASAGDFDA